ncbi:hypothetical protein [Roseinatronobacter alkalisoli]|uniref:Uncharacterized protein n=1 Tax=Roseinatronobacter alkalisoli TaxID=3028235 RepID=A0ABT5TAH1_9RHOB|nr:hypothetical protein [Roseinatronobacter sp. HJB301]MDD7971401.1 hypothetical protein [Roseinatronobacter sp. HJB301]
MKRTLFHITDGIAIILSCYGSAMVTLALGGWFSSLLEKTLPMADSSDVMIFGTFLLFFTSSGAIYWIWWRFSPFSLRMLGENKIEHDERLSFSNKSKRFFAIILMLLYSCIFSVFFLLLLIGPIPWHRGNLFVFGYFLLFVSSSGLIFWLWWRFSPFSSRKLRGKDD